MLPILSNVPPDSICFALLGDNTLTCFPILSPPFIPVFAPSRAAILNPPLKICAPPAKTPPHMNPSIAPPIKPSSMPSQPPVIPPIKAPIPILIPTLIPVCMVADNNAEPNAAMKPDPVPAVNAVTNAPATIMPSPISNFPHHGIFHESSSEDAGSFAILTSTLYIYGISSSILSHRIPFLSRYSFINQNFTRILTLFLAYSVRLKGRSSYLRPFIMCFMLS